MKDYNKLKTINIFSLINSSLFLFASIFLLYYAKKTEIVSEQTLATRQMTPMVVPRVVLTLLALFSIIILLKSIYWLLKNGSIETKNELISSKTLMTFGLIFLYYISWRIIGFTLSNIWYVAIQVKILEPSRSWNRLIIFSFVFTIVCKFLFATVFRVLLPENIFEYIMQLPLSQY